MLTIAGPDQLEGLFDECGWGTVTLRYEHCPVPPPAAELAGAHLVPFDGNGDVVVSRVEDGQGPDHWLLAGGTIEPGETWRDAAARELLEEAGARMIDITPFGVVRLHDSGPTRWRPHLAWPESAWVIAWAQVEIVGPPVAAEGAEQIVEVRTVSVDEAVALLEPVEGRMFACICRLASWLRANACARPC